MSRNDDDTPRSSRDAFVRATATLLRRQGYSGSGLTEIVAASGAPRGSLYFHFPGGKQQLAVAAMEQSGAQLRQAIAAVLAQSEDVGESLATLAEALARGLEASGFTDGCPIATVALEQSSTTEPLRVAAAGAFDSWLQVLRERLQQAGMAAPAAERRALLVLSAIEGALILARAKADVAPLIAVGEELRALSL